MIHDVPRAWSDTFTAADAIAIDVMDPETRALVERYARSQVSINRAVEEDSSLFGYDEEDDDEYEWDDRSAVRT